MAYEVVGLLAHSRSQPAVSVMPTFVA